MASHDQVILAQKNNCAVTKYNCCNNFHLLYQNVSLHGSRVTLFDIASHAYDFEAMEDQYKSKNILKISISAVDLHVSNEDFTCFFQVIQTATNKELQINKLYKTREAK